MSNQHVLKIHPAPLADLLSGAKTAEVRRNDRGFQVGDTVRLMEVNPETLNWTGRPDLVRTISHIQTGYGLPDGLCVLSYADTAQREALARVEAEAGRLAEAGLAAHVKANAAQAQLAEAVGLLRKKQEYLEAPYPYGAYSYGSDGTARTALAEVKAFLARHAQAEQKEAREPAAAEVIDSLTHPLCVISLRGDDRQKALANDLAKIIRQYQSDGQEAQGAQAGDSPVDGMEEFLADLARSRGKYPNNARMFDGLLGEVDELRRAYAGDGDVRAEAFDVAVCAFRIATEGDSGGNAALATQPAAGEPVAFDGKTVADRLDQMADAQPSGSSAQSDLYAAATVWRKHLAPPAAADGDEAVRKDAERYRWVREPSSGNEMWAMICAGECGGNMDAAIDAAMRAQGDGGEI